MKNDQEKALDQNQSKREFVPLSALVETKTHQIGEIRRAREIGFKGKHKYIWGVCQDCGKGRWELLVKGGPLYPRCKSCAPKVKGQTYRGHNSPNWKGGRMQTSRGYILLLLQPDDFFYPMAKHDGYVLEHRLVMAKHLGRCLHDWEIVHHKGTKYPKGSIENKKDNRIENLQLVTDERHKQITILENRIKQLEGRVTQLEAENILLKVGVNYGA